MCVMDSGDRCDVWDETQVKAAKDRRCSCCDQTIRKGDSYLRHKSLFDGSWTAESLCLECKRMRAVFADDLHHLTPTPGSFYDTLWECVDHWDARDPWWPLLNELRARMGKEPEYPLNHSAEAAKAWALSLQLKPEEMGSANTNRSTLGG